MPTFFTAQKHQLVMKLLISIDFDMIVESNFYWRNNEKNEESSHFGNNSNCLIRTSNHQFSISKLVFY